MVVSNVFRSRHIVITGFISLISILYSTNAHAHVTWFVANEGGFAGSRFTPDLLSLLVAVGAIGFLLFGGWLESHSKKAQSQSFLYRHWTDGRYVDTAIRISVAILLLGNIIQGHFIAPNIPIEHHSVVEPSLQAILIILMILNGEIFSIAILGLCVYLIDLYGFNIAIDYVFELSAIAVALIFCSPNSLVFSNKLALQLRLNYALTALRIGLGLQLCILTIHDKLSHPGLALQFLADYPYFNFIQYIGFEGFKDIHFVLGAGLAELCFGVLLLANIAQRLSSFCICFFFGLSGVVLGPAELLGHVPILAVAAVLLLNPAPPLRNLVTESYKFKNTFMTSSQKASE